MNKVVAITGAARGIGLATAREALRRGAEVVIGDIDGESVEMAAAELGHHAHPVQVDVSDAESMAAWLQNELQLEGAPGRVRSEPPKPVAVPGGTVFLRTVRASSYARGADQAWNARMLSSPASWPCGVKSTDDSV